MMIVRFDLSTYFKPKDCNAIWIDGEAEPNFFRKDGKEFKITYQGNPSSDFYPIKVKVTGQVVDRHQTCETVEVEAIISFPDGKKKFKGDMQINQDDKAKYRRMIDELFEETFGSINDEAV